MSSEREAWLEERRTGITATDVCRLVCPWDADRPEAARIFDEKRSPVADREPSNVELIGLATEDLNAAIYAKRTGFEFQQRPRYHIDRDGWQLASLDRRAVGGRVVELKYTRFFHDDWGAEYTDEFPLRHIVQVTWQMRVTGEPWADLSAIDGGGEHRIYRIGCDTALSDALAEIAAAVWAMVQRGERPAEDWTHPLAARLRDDHAAAIAGRKVVIESQAAEFAATEWLHFKGVEREAANLADERRAELVRAMGDAEEAECGPYLLSRKPRARLVKALPAKPQQRRKAVTL